MKFKDFIDIDGLKHAKIEEKPVKNYKGDYKELPIAKPSSNGSNATYDEIKELHILESLKITTLSKDSVKAVFVIDLIHKLSEKFNSFNSLTCKKSDLLMCTNKYLF